MRSTNITKFEQIRKFEDDLNRCTQCGYCTFWCPLYQEEPLETSVARGKVSAIRKLLSTDGYYDEIISSQVNRCMLCLTCAEHCPAKTNVPNAILAAKADKVKAKGVPFPQNIIFKWFLPRPALFGRVVKFTSWLQWMFMPKTEGTIRHLAFFLSAMGKGRRIPQIAPHFLKQIVPIVNKPPDSVKTKMKVGYFIGCATNFVFPDLGRKIISFLTKNGMEVLVPKEQGCCGAPVYLGAGDFETGRKMADINVKVFKDVDYVISGCATCTSALKDYKKFLADTPEREETFAKFSDKVKDISQFLVDVLKLPPEFYKARSDLKNKKITWHDPCHLNRHLGVKDQPRQIIKSLQGVEYREMVRPDWCCGMAGSFSIYYYDLSKKIADKKMETIRATQADIVATGCPGCMIQLIDNTVRHNMPVKVLHLMELLE
jgi:glycolate oxidase iron-sulfur subunit